MVDVFEITSRETLIEDPAWAELQEGKRLAAIFYHNNYGCLCRHSSSHHGPSGCVADGCLCGPANRLRNRKQAEGWAEVQELDRVYVHLRVGPFKGELGWIVKWDEKDTKLDRYARNDYGLGQFPTYDAVLVQWVYPSNIAVKEHVEHLCLCTKETVDKLLPLAIVDALATL